MKANAQEDVIKQLNPLLRGFANYYRGVVSKETFSYVRYRTYEYLRNWGLRRHSEKSKKWVLNRYYGRFGGENYTFMCKGTGRKGKEKLHILNNISSTPIVRHIKVKGNSSPDDPSLRNYWQKRATDSGKKYWTKGSKNEAIANFQSWKCPVCGDSLFNGEPIETHHIVPAAEGGSDDTENLKHLHKACHKQVHTKTKLTALK